MRDDTAYIATVAAARFRANANELHAAAHGLHTATTPEARATHRADVRRIAEHLRSCADDVLFALDAAPA